MKVKCQGGGLGILFLHCLLNIRINCISVPHFPPNRRCCEFGNPPWMLNYEKTISQLLFTGKKSRSSVALWVGFPASCPGPHSGPSGKQQALRDSHPQPECGPFCPGLLRSAAVSLFSCVSPSFPHLNPPPPNPPVQGSILKDVKLEIINQATGRGNS